MIKNYLVVALLIWQCSLFGQTDFEVSVSSLTSWDNTYRKASFQVDVKNVGSDSLVLSDVLGWYYTSSNLVQLYVSSDTILDANDTYFGSHNLSRSILDSGATSSGIVYLNESSDLKLTVDSAYYVFATIGGVYHDSTNSNKTRYYEYNDYLVGDLEMNDTTRVPNASKSTSFGTVRATDSTDVIVSLKKWELNLTNNVSMTNSFVVGEPTTSDLSVSMTSSFTRNRYNDNDLINVNYTALVSNSYKDVDADWVAVVLKDGNGVTLDSIHQENVAIAAYSNLFIRSSFVIDSSYAGRQSLYITVYSSSDEVSTLNNTDTAVITIHDDLKTVTRINVARVEGVSYDGEFENWRTTRQVRVNTTQTFSDENVASGVYTNNYLNKNNIYFFTAIDNESWTLHSTGAQYNGSGFSKNMSVGDTISRDGYLNSNVTYNLRIDECGPDTTKIIAVSTYYVNLSTDDIESYLNGVISIDGLNSLMSSSVTNAEQSLIDNISFSSPVVIKHSASFCKESPDYGLSVTAIAKEDSLGLGILEMSVVADSIPDAIYVYYIEASKLADNNVVTSWNKVIIDTLNQDKNYSGQTIKININSVNPNTYYYYSAAGITNGNIENEYSNGESVMFTYLSPDAVLTNNKSCGYPQNARFDISLGEEQPWLVWDSITHEHDRVKVLFKPTGTSTWAAKSFYTDTNAVSFEGVLETETSYDFMLQSVCNDANLVASNFSDTVKITTGSVKSIVCPDPLFTPSAALADDAPYMNVAYDSYSGWEGNLLRSKVIYHLKGTKGRWDVKNIFHNDSTIVNASAIYGLLADTTYEIQMLNICQNGYSEYSDILEITTQGTTLECNTPTGLVASSSTNTFNTELVYTDEANVSVDRYIVAYKEAIGNVWTTSSSTNISQTLYTLKPSTEYYFMVQSYCDESKEFISAYSDTTIYTTPATEIVVCEHPKHFQVASNNVVDDNSSEVTISWTEDEINTDIQRTQVLIRQENASGSWPYQWVFKSGDINDDTLSNTFDLIPGQTYNLMIRTLCFSGSVASDFSEKITFTAAGSVARKGPLAEELYSVKKEIVVYPNPATDYVYIDGVEEFNKSVSFYSLDSHNSSYLLQGVDNVIDVSTLGTGVYLMSFVVEGEYIQQRIVIE